MGSKKHKKHKSEKKEQFVEERIEKPLRLVLKVSGNTASRSETPSDFTSENSSISVKTEPSVSYLSNEVKYVANHPEYEIPRSEKHKKSKKKKKKKSSEKDKEKKHKHHKHHHHHHHHHHKSEKKHEVESFDLKDGIRECTNVVDEVATIPEKQTTDFHPPISEEVGDKAPTIVESAPPSPIVSKIDKKNLQTALTSMFKTLQKKDPDQFFAWPVSDVIAPGYSSIIQYPMDFSTMKEKIDKCIYNTVEEFKDDVKLICGNCMTYNHPETVYYKSAKRLLHSASKMMSKEKMSTLNRSLIIVEESPLEENLNQNVEPESSIKEAVAESSEPQPVPTKPEESADVKEVGPPKKRAKLAASDNTSHETDINSCYVLLNSSKMKEIPEKKSKPEEKSYDGLTPSEILKQAQEAAKCAADKLTLRHPNSNIGYLRQKDDGSTSLAITNAEYGKPNERDVNLGMLIGKLQSGTGTLNSFQEDSRNLAKPIKTLNYGSFCSFAPQYDSAFANLNKEETELVYSSYGDDIGVQYAESLINFAQDSNYVMSLVDNLLDVLTNGEHSKAASILEEKKMLKLETELLRKEMLGVKAPSESEQVDDSMNDEESENQLKLDQNAELIQDLQQVQHERLSQRLPNHLSYISSASEKEVKIAEKVQNKLKELTQQVSPQTVVDQKSIHKAMGIIPPH